MSPVFIISCAVIALLTACRTEGSRQTFCLLWALVLISWQFIAMGAEWLAPRLSDAQYSTLVFTQYLTCFGMNMALIWYLTRNLDSGYGLIALPIAFYAILSLLVVIEFKLTKTLYAYHMFIDAGLIVNSIEIILLLGGDHGLRRYSAARSRALRPVSRANLHLPMGP